MKKKVLGFITMFVMVFGVCFMMPSDEVSAAALDGQTIANYVNAKVGNSYPNGMCTKFVEECYQALGGGRPYNCCASKSGNLYIKSNSSSNIPVGATVYFGNCGGGPCKTCGSSFYGHVGIYVGNGYFVHATGGSVQKSTISSWSNKYRGWGYNNNFTLKNTTPDPPAPTETPVNIGTNFYAMIINTNYWKPLGVQDDGNICLTTEKNTNFNRTLWHFTRNSDGSYRAVSFYNNKSLDARDNKNEVQLYTYDTIGDNNYQKWFVYWSGNGVKLRPAISSDKYMDLAGNRKDDGTPIVMYTGNDTTAQVWSIYQLDGGRDKLNYSISTDKSIADAGKTVNITVGGSIPYVYNYRFHVVSSDGKDTVINNGCNPVYGFSNNNTGRYTIYAEIQSPLYSEKGSITNKSVTVDLVANIGNDFSAFIINTNYWKPIGVQDDGTICLTTEKNTNHNRTLWHFTRNSDGSYRAVSYYNNKSLDAREDKNEVNLYTYDTIKDNNYQKWYVYYTGKGAKLRPAISSDKYMDLSGNKKDDGTQIILYTNNDTDAQVWSIYQLDAARDKLNYTITASNANPAINAKVNINISGSLPYVYNYKIHIVDPTGKEAVVDNLCNPTYSFSRATPGKYIIYAEVTSPLYKETGSKTNKAVTVNVACTHNWGVWTTTKNATCATEGVQTHKCSICGATATQAIPKTTSHTWSSWTTSKAATCTSDGQQTRKCSICGMTETQTISKTGHHYQETVIQPTYSEQGYTLHKCTGCGDSYKDKYVAKKRGYDPAKKPVASEVKKLQQLLTKKAKLASNEDLVDMFDANGDGKVNVFDVLILKRRALK